jgi:hypothetical protein
MTEIQMTVNLADPKDVREKMPEIKRLLAAARQELKDLNAQVELLARLVGERGSDSTAAASTRPQSKPRRKTRTRTGTSKPAPAQEQAVRALEHAGRPMGPAELYRFMEAHDLPRPNTLERLGSVLWAAAKAGRLVGMDGMYSPADGFPAQQTTQSSFGAPTVAASSGGNGVVADQASPNGSHHSEGVPALGSGAGSREGPG